ncbi:MAG: class I SAM-dependent methyltransferase [Armatimonadota bacterium]
MIQSLKRLARQMLPKRMLRALVPAWNLLARSKVRRAQAAYLRAGNAPAWLGRDEFDSLCRSYAPPPAYGTDADSLERRGRERAAEVLAVLPPNAQAQTFLEIGCGDGMIGYFLQGQGKTATGIDLATGLFAARAAAAGVCLAQMDATALEFEDNNFDGIYSYNTFEHLSDPEKVLREAIRVAKPGGCIYLNFGPLYDSPMGLHAYYQVPIPYCQHLFPAELLDEIAGMRLGASLNRWPLTQFRELWQRVAPLVTTLRYCERLETHGVELIERYPVCFKSKVDLFDSLVVSAIEVLFRKK